MTTQEKVAQEHVLFRVELCFTQEPRADYHIAISCGFKSCPLFLNGGQAIAIKYDPYSTINASNAWDEVLAIANNHLSYHIDQAMAKSHDYQPGELFSEDEK